MLINKLITTTIGLSILGIALLTLGGIVSPHFITSVSAQTLPLYEDFLTHTTEFPVSSYESEKAHIEWFNEELQRKEVLRFNFAGKTINGQYQEFYATAIFIQDNWYIDENYPNTNVISNQNNFQTTECYILNNGTYERYYDYTCQAPNQYEDIISSDGKFQYIYERNETDSDWDLIPYPTIEEPPPEEPPPEEPPTSYTSELEALNSINQKLENIDNFIVYAFHIAYYALIGFLAIQFIRLIWWLFFHEVRNWI